MPLLGLQGIYDEPEITTDGGTLQGNQLNSCLEIEDFGVEDLDTQSGEDEHGKDAEGEDDEDEWNTK